MPTPQPHVSQAQPQGQPQAAVWSGTYLRRNTDLSAMLSAREQLNELLGDVPLTLMVARAAQRHLGLLNLSSLAVADAQGQALTPISAAICAAESRRCRTPSRARSRPTC